MKLYILFLPLALAACNYMHVKPGTMERDEVVYASRGGYSMRRAIKEAMEERGYNVVVGKAKSSRTLTGDGDELDNIDFDTTAIPANAKYIVQVRERRERFFPIWCFFNGYWWWNFNVSIADQKTGDELLSWSGRGCANSSLRKLDNVLDKLEK
jgi:hypothetical protein